MTTSWNDIIPISNEMKIIEASTKKLETKKMGRGTFGHVTTSEKLGKLYAVKKMINKIELGSRSEKIGIPRGQIIEAVQMIKLRHPNIVGAIDVEFEEIINYDQKRLCITMPLAVCTLLTWIENFWDKKTTKCSDIFVIKDQHGLQKKRSYQRACSETMRRFAFNMFAAVAHLQLNQVSHNDIKPENFLAFNARGNDNDNENDNGKEKDKDNEARTIVLRLSDFGSSTLPGASTRHTGGTRRYQAPEVRVGLNNKVLNAGDIWGLGMIMLELFFGVYRSRDRAHEKDGATSASSSDSSYYDSNSEEGDDEMTKKAAAKIKYKWEHRYKGIHEMLQRTRKRYNFAKVYGARYYNAVLDLITKCFDRNPTRRIDALTALRHPFFNACYDDDGHADGAPKTNGATMHLDYFYHIYPCSKFLALSSTTAASTTASTTMKHQPIEIVQKVRCSILAMLRNLISIDEVIECAVMLIAHKILRLDGTFKLEIGTLYPGVKRNHLLGAEILVCELLKFQFF